MQDEGEYKGYKWVKCKCADRAGQMWATVTLGRWLRALGSVYITLTDQAKNSHQTKGNAPRPPIRALSAEHAAVHCKHSSAEALWTCESHAMLPSSRAQTNCLLFSRGQGRGGFTEDTLRSRVYAAAGAFTCYLRTPSRSGCKASAPARGHCSTTRARI